MKKSLSLLLSMLLLLSIFSVTAFATEENDISKFELPAPKAPTYFVYTDGDEKESRHDDLRMIMISDPEVALLAAEYSRNSEAFYEKYGLYSFAISMQYDVSLDGEDNWQHNSEWDTNWYTGGYADGYPYVSLGSEMMEDFEFFWLTYYEGEGSATFTPYQPAITTYVSNHGDWEENIYSFDVENHSLYIRCRYYMEWETYDAVKNEIGKKQSKFSDWSQSAVFGRNSTQIVPDEPTVYEAPVISDMKIVLSEGDENSHIEYAQTTLESVWMNGVYYIMKGEGEFEGLETQISIDGGDWVEFDTADAGGDWCLYNGIRGAYSWEHPIEENSHVKLRIRFVGTHGPSEWSNILEINGGGTQEMAEQAKKPAAEKPTAETSKEDKCSLCGFCPEPLGLCIFIWIAVLIVIILIVVIIIVTANKKKKCPNCKTKCEKSNKWCPRCGAPLK